MQKNWFGLALIVLFVALVYLFFWEFEAVAPAVDEQATPDENLPTAYATNVISKKFRADGGLDFYFEANRAEYYRANPKKPGPDDYVLLESPFASLYELNKTGSNELTWHIQALSGTARNDFNLVELSGEVEGWKPESQGRAVEFFTSRLSLETDTQFTHTEAPVELRLSTSLSRGQKGMQARLKQQNIILFDVRTIHERQP